jgi:hypothetical protein
MSRLDFGTPGSATIDDCDQSLLTMRALRSQALKMDHVSQ